MEEATSPRQVTRHLSAAISVDTDVTDDRCCRFLRQRLRCRVILFASAGFFSSAARGLRLAVSQRAALTLPPLAARTPKSN